MLAPAAFRPIKPEKIFPRVATREEFFLLSNRYQEGNPYYHHGLQPGQWFEIERAEFFYMLGVLPPLGHIQGSFALCEFTRDDLTESFHKVGDRYACMLIRYRDPSSVGFARRLIMEFFSRAA